MTTLRVPDRLITIDEVMACNPCYGADEIERRLQEQNAWPGPWHLSDCAHFRMGRFRDTLWVFGHFLPPDVARAFIVRTALRMARRSGTAVGYDEYALLVAAMRCTSDELRKLHRSIFSDFRFEWTFRSACHPNTADAFWMSVADASHMVSGIAQERGIECSTIQANRLDIMVDLNHILQTGKMEEPQL